MRACIEGPPLPVAVDCRGIGRLLPAHRRGTGQHEQCLAGLRSRLPRPRMAMARCHKAAERPASDPDLLAGLDTDHDGTVSLDEAKKAAEIVFDKVDRDHDGTLTARELRGRLSAREFTAADTDKDGTLSKDEYLAVVQRRFKAADTDNDGTLTRRELRSKAGRQLLLLLRGRKAFAAFGSWKLKPKWPRKKMIRLFPAIYLNPLPGARAPPDLAADRQTTAH